MTEKEVFSTMVQFEKDHEAIMKELCEAVKMFADSTKQNREVYDSHLKSVELSRDKAQDMLADLIRTVELLRLDYSDMVKALRSQLHQAVDQIRKYEKQGIEYESRIRELENAITRMTSHLAAGGVTVTMDNGNHLK